MTRNEAKLKIIKDTVVNSILSEMDSELRNKVSDEKKIEAMISLTKSRLRSILNSFDEKELLPKGDVDSPQDFEKHILRIMQGTKQRILTEMEKEK